MAATPSPVSMTPSSTHTVVSSYERQSPSQAKTELPSFAYLDVNTYNSHRSPVKLTPMTDDFDLKFYNAHGITPLKEAVNSSHFMDTSKCLPI